ncbi:MAG: protein kinase, partial [Candidatus Aminicenantes bacterium]|nr:protein kinase [Candidatus Aminicenantes bacterium]
MSVELKKDTIISHYKILEKLGQGGMGVVYKAEDTKLDRLVALKFLPKQFSINEEEKKRFIHEAKAAAALDHPNICSVYEIDETEDGQMFIAMAYYEGETLKDKITSGPLPLTEVIDIAIQVAEGLNKAHKKDIVHRDIKAANIMMTNDGVAKIVDFGLAKLKGQTKLTKEGTTLGTVAYMSPEQTTGEETDHRSDIWSLGVLLYEMITGKLPFKGEYEQAIMYAIMNEEQEPITGLRTGVSMDLEKIINKYLEKKSSNRYQHTDELIVDLRRLKKESELKEAQKGAGVKIKTPKKKTLLHTLSGAFLVVMILAIAGYLLFTPGKNGPVSERKMLVVLPFENLGPAEDEYFATGISEEIANRLASITSLGVISRKSALHYAKTDKTLQQIGKELGVQYILEGTVRWARANKGPGRVRITPKLIRVSDDTQLWGNTYERVVNDIFEIQSDIAQRIFEQLEVTYLESEHKTVEVIKTKNLDAYQAYLRGRYYAGQPHFTLENWKKVIQNFKQAVEFDPEFALAFAELSRAHSRLYYLRHDLSEERREMARRAAERAVELAPDSPEIHLALGYYHLWAYRDSEKALKEWALAEKSLPNNVEILTAKATFFEPQGRWEEAIATLKTAFKLSPRDASIATNLAGFYFFSRRYQQAIEMCNQAIALAPDLTWPYLYKTFTYWCLKDTMKEARSALESVPKDHSWAPWAWFWQEFREGHYQDALEHLSSTPGNWIRLTIHARPKSLLSAFVYDSLNKPQLAHSAYDTAKTLLETEVRVRPNDPRLHSSLGIVYSALGRKKEAIQEGKLAT